MNILSTLFNFHLVISTLFTSLLVNWTYFSFGHCLFPHQLIVCALFIQEYDYLRTVTINTDYIHNNDFSINEKDKKFLIEVKTQHKLNKRTITNKHTPFSIHIQSIFCPSSLNFEKAHYIMLLRYIFSPAITTWLFLFECF